MILEGERKAEAEKDPIAAKYIRKYLDAKGLIYGKERWILWLKDSTPEEREKSPILRKALERVKEARKRGAWREKPAWLPVNIAQPDTAYLAIPETFSEGRIYFTAGYEPENVIASNAVYACPDHDPLAFSVIESSMFMAWQDLVGGRLKTDNRFSNTLVWNTFPLPKLTKTQKDALIEGGRKVLEARANYPSSSLYDLYDPGNCPQDLRKAHQALDKAMDKIFSDKPLKSEEERQRALLEAYQKIKSEKEG